MYCTKCNKFFKTSEQHCPVCNELLISNKSEDTTSDFVKVFESSDLGLTAIIKSILINADIEYLVKGEHMQSILGGQFSFAFSADIGKVEFFVTKEDEEVAVELLKELNQ